MFISFEGGEGCGKSTHVKLLKEYLEGKGIGAIFTREPGATEVGKKIRDILLSPKSSLSAFAEVFLFAADRAEHAEKVILPALKAGKIVISDRFTDSTLAYQIGGRGLPEDLVRYVNMISSQGLIPDLTFLLDIAVEEGIRRSSTRDRFEKESLDFHKKVRAYYLELARQDSKRIKVINSSKSIDEVQREIRKIVNTKMSD